MKNYDVFENNKSLEASFKVIYILGPLRGGSTLLERILNSAHSTVAVGELDHLWRRNISNLVCSCTSKVSDCEFWRDVLSISGLGSVELGRLAILERTIVRSYFLATHRFSLNVLQEDERVQEFLSLQNALYSAIAIKSGCTTIVDSSKSGPRGWLLGILNNVLIVHLHRKAEEVLCSWSRQKWDPVLNQAMEGHSVLNAALGWARVEILAILLAKNKKVARINYSNLIGNPKSTLERVLYPECVDLLHDLRWIDDATVAPSNVYHSVSGNPDRFVKGNIIISKRDQHMDNLAAIERTKIIAAGKFLDWILR